MSFTSQVKEEMARVEPICSHCDKAALAALVRIEGTLFMSGRGRYRIEIASDSPSVARLSIKLLHGLYSLQTNLTMRRSVLHKTPNYLIDVPTQPGLAQALHDMGILNSEGGLILGLDEELVRKDCCAAAYLRGAFLGSGFIADPRGDFHFEISLESETLANDIVGLLARKQIHARIMQRRNSYIVYLKSGSEILAFLAFANAHKAALEMEEQRVFKSVRNDVNRHVNAELANQQKTTNASADQVEAIHKVVKHYGMSNLPAGIQDFIRLRLKHPSLSMKELGEAANPPLSKSAINHRARRVEQMAREIE